MYVLNYILSFFPRALPVGKTEFETWSTRILSLSGEYADKDSMIWALASQIMHGAKASVPDRYFVNALRKAAANQVASQIFQDIKTKQLEAQEQQKQQAVIQTEATTPVVADAKA